MDRLTLERDVENNKYELETLRSKVWGSLILITKMET